MGTWDGSMMKVYIDGVEKNSVGLFSGALSFTSEPMRVGRYFPGAGYYFNGKIDNAMIYDRALSADEVGAIYEAQRKS